jgi:hypothetical protein
MDQDLLNFMPINRIGKLFFNVEESPVLFDYRNNIVHYHGKKVIINDDKHQAISIVPDNFLALSNGHAFNLGVEIFEILFGITPTVHKEYGNSNGTEYCVDLVSKDLKIVFKNNGYYIQNGNSDISSNSNATVRNSDVFLNENFHDEYHPFVRVHNSLRSNRSFYIEMGYYRYACSNGMLLGRKTKITFKHSYIGTSFDAIRRSAIEHFRHNKFNMTEFAEKLWFLLSTHISRGEMRKVSFDIFEKALIKVDGKKREILQGQLSDLVTKYAMEIGENLNAALNVSTDFAKLLEESDVPTSSLQNLPVIWLNKVSKKDFQLERYLGQIAEIEMQVMSAKSKKEILEEED